RYSAEQLYSDKREISRAEAQKYLIEKLAADGFVITQFTINETRVPEQVKAAINAKVAMIQDAQKTEQETRKIRALADQKVPAAATCASSTCRRSRGSTAAGPSARPCRPGCAPRPPRSRSWSG